MSFWQKIFYKFSFFTDPFERNVGRFFAHLKEGSSKSFIIDKLTKQIQKNIVIVNLWTERNYKGYEYLTKNTRKKLYSNSILIKNDFEKFYANQSGNNSNELIEQVKELGVIMANQPQNTQKLTYLSAIMNYLSPIAGRYAYRESSTFGKLLVDPSAEQMVGDCNQIVTLYIYLYSLKYDVTDLQLKVSPSHVALHYMGVDIEATSGKFEKYQKDDYKLLPIQEIVSINLLDVTDSNFSTHKVSPRSFLQSARLAYLISSEHETVRMNLRVAYNNVVRELMINNDYNLALKYALQSDDSVLIKTVGHNGAIYYLKDNQFSLARRLAHYSDDEKDLAKKISYSQGIAEYNAGRFNEAIRYFSNIGENDLVKKCYEGLYFAEQKKLGQTNTTDTIKQKSSVIRNMQSYAKRSGNKQLIDHADNLAKYI